MDLMIGLLFRTSRPANVFSTSNGIFSMGNVFSLLPIDVETFEPATPFIVKLILGLMANFFANSLNPTGFRLKGVSLKFNDILVTLNFVIDLSILSLATIVLPSNIVTFGKFSFIVKGN